MLIGGLALLYLCVYRALSHITVCGNGTHSGKGIAHYYKYILLQAKVPLCVLNCGVKKTLCQAEHGRASYNRKYENAAGSSA